MFPKQYRLFFKGNNIEIFLSQFFMLSKVPVNYYFFNENFVKTNKGIQFYFKKNNFYFQYFFYKYNILYENNHTFFLLYYVICLCNMSKFLLCLVEYVYHPIKLTVFNKYIRSVLSQLFILILKYLYPYWCNETWFYLCVSRTLFDRFFYEVTMEISWID